MRFQHKNWVGGGQNSAYNRVLGGKATTYGCVSYALYNSKMCYPQHSYHKFVYFLMENFPAGNFITEIFWEEGLPISDFHRGPLG